MADLAQPLNYRMPIVNADGIPTEFFMRWAQQFSDEAEEGLSVKVDGPASSTDTAIARFDGVTGKLLQDSVVTLTDVGTFNGVASLNMSGRINVDAETAVIFNGTVYGDAVGTLPIFLVRKARGAVGAPTEVMTNDVLGRFSFRGYTGSTYAESAYLQVRAAENASSGGGGRIEFWTKPNGGGGVTERLRINESGLVQSFGDLEVPDEAYGAGWNGSTEVPTKNAVYDKIESLGGGGSSAGARITRSTTQSITVNTDTAISFDTEVIDDSSFWAAGNPTRFTAPSAGWYSLAGTVKWPANTGLGRQVWWRTSNSGGTTVYDNLGRHSQPADSIHNDPWMTSSALVYMDSGDYAEFFVFTNQSTVSVSDCVGTLVRLP